MSNDVTTKKRSGIQETKNTENSTVNTKTEISLENANPNLEDFNWDAHEEDCPTRVKKVNQTISTPVNCKVYSKEPYAESLLNLMLGFEEKNDTKFEVKVGKTYTGSVYSVNAEWAIIDINYREMVYVDMSRETQEIKNQLVPGATIDVQLLKINDKAGKGFILGSVGAGIKTALFNEIMQSIDNNDAYAGKVIEMIPAGGYIVEINGVECFMPGSLAGINKLHDFESIIGTTMYVVPMSFSVKRGTIVVSHREYLKAMIPNEIEKLNENIEGEKTGMVTGTTKFGVFVEFNQCLTGMIHVNDLEAEFFKKHKAREIKAGDEINFYVKEIINENKIILSQVKTEPVVDPWKDIENTFKTPSEVQGTVKSVKDYGLFVEIKEGVTGLLHISEIENIIDIKTIKPGDAITVQVTRIESSTRKVFLKI